MFIQKSSKIEEAVRIPAKPFSFDGMPKMPGDGPMEHGHSHVAPEDKDPKYAALEIDNGQLTVRPESIYGGKYDGKCAKDLRIAGYDTETGGVYATGEETDYTLENAYIFVDGDSTEHNNAEAGKYSAAFVDGGAKLTIRNSVLLANGCERDTLGCGDKSEIRVYDSFIGAMGAPFGDDLPEGVESRIITKGHILYGNTRTFCCVGASKSYFYNSTITANGWGALATDMSFGGLYLEANDCRVITSKSGYGTYANGQCTNVFNRCDFDCASMTIIEADETKAIFNDCTSKNGTHFAVVYCVMPDPNQTAELELNRCQITSEDAVFLIKSANTDFRVRNCKLSSASGELVKGIVNDDPHAAKVGGEVFGINVHYVDCELEGNMVNEDTDRRMNITLERSVLKGALTNLALYMKDGAKWVATGDSQIYLGSDIDIDSIDAMPGVTILAHGDAEYETALPSGGKLQVVCD